MPYPGWPELTPDNCFFIVLHSRPIGRFVRRQKRFESRPRRVHRKFVALISAMVDCTGLGWESDPTIKPNRIYAVGRVDHIRPGTYKAWDWMLDPIVILSPPISLRGVAVGRVGAGHVSPRTEHAEALTALNVALSSHALPHAQKSLGMGKTNLLSCSTSTWEATGSEETAVAMAHPVTEVEVPISMIVNFQEIKHKKWSVSLQEADLVEVTPNRELPFLGTVITHMRVKKNPDGSEHNSKGQFQTFVKDFTVRTHTLPLLRLHLYVYIYCMQMPIYTSICVLCAEQASATRPYFVLCARE
jgi:hypothetical protein